MEDEVVLCQGDVFRVFKSEGRFDTVSAEILKVS